MTDWRSAAVATPPSGQADRASGTDAPSFRSRVLIALLFGAVGVLLVFVAAHREGASDLDQVLVGSRMLLKHRDPYSVVGPGRAFEWPWPLYYPATALIAVLPIAFLPVLAARALFFGISSALLAFVLTRRAWFPLVLFSSAAYLRAAELVQWSPMLTAAALVPALGWLVLAVKPNLGLALWAAYPTRVAVVGALALLGLSLALEPHWPTAWLRAVASAPHFRAPIAQIVGLPLALAALRWRRPEARLLLAMACVPQTPLVYETVPLFLVPRTLRQAVVLTLGADIAHWAAWSVPASAGYAAYFAHAGRLTTALVYLPALVMVLRRPNEGELPAWMRRCSGGPRS